MKTRILFYVNSEELVIDLTGVVSEKKVKEHLQNIYQQAYTLINFIFTC
jgi:hypothetical protein